MYKIGNIEINNPVAVAPMAGARARRAAADTIRLPPRWRPLCATPACKSPARSAALVIRPCATL